MLVGLTNANQRPKFEIVTGVSTGALIAPFAFLGSDWDGKLTEAYRGEATDRLLVSRGLGVLFGGCAAPPDESEDAGLSDDGVGADALVNVELAPGMHLGGFYAFRWQEALAAGASVVIVGGAITKAPDAAKAARWDANCSICRRMLPQTSSTSVRSS